MQTFYSSLKTLLFLLPVLFFSSCEKDPVRGCTDTNATNYDKDATEDDGSCSYAVNYQTLAKDASITESLYNDLFKVVDEESKNGEFRIDIGKTMFTRLSIIDTCAVVTINTNGGNWPFTITVDFGDGCTDALGIERSGKVIAVYSGPYTTQGSKINVSVDNFVVNGNKIEGNQTITNDGRNSAGNLQYSVEVSNGVITKPNGGTITWQSTRTNEWTEGKNTNGWIGLCDDVYSITGFGEGTTSDGTNYRIDIEDPLIKKVCCYWVVDGSISFELNGNKIATVDYGDGTCNFNANLTYGNNTIVIIIT